MYDYNYMSCHFGSILRKSWPPPGCPYLHVSKYSKSLALWCYKLQELSCC